MTLQDKYTAVVEGKYSKEQFRKDAFCELPQFVSKFNSFEDTVQILKNKSILQEASHLRGMSLEQAEEYARTVSEEEGVVQHVNQLEDGSYEVSDWYDSDTTEVSYENGNMLENKTTCQTRRVLKEEFTKYKQEKGSTYSPAVDNPEDFFSFEEIQRGIDYELEAAGFDSALPESFTEEAVEKAKKKTLQNLEKDRLYYLNLLAGRKEGEKRTDQMKTLDAHNHVDLENGMQKVQLKEAIKKLIIKTLDSNPETLTEGRVQRMWEVGRAYPGYGKAMRVEGERGRVSVKFHTQAEHIFEMDSESGIWQEIKDSVNEGEVQESHHIHPEQFEYLHGLTLTKAEEAMVKAAKIIAKDLEKEIPVENDLIRNFILVLLDKHLQNKL